MITTEEAERILSDTETHEKLMHLEAQARIALMDGAEPCPVCGFLTPDPRQYPPCYVTYVGRSERCPGITDGSDGSA